MSLWLFYIQSWVAKASYGLTDSTRYKWMNSNLFPSLPPSLIYISPKSSYLPSNNQSKNKKIIITNKKIYMYSQEGVVVWLLLLHHQHICMVDLGEPMSLTLSFHYLCEETRVFIGFSFNPMLSGDRSSGEMQDGLRGLLGLSLNWYGLYNP